jgi:hypothetical protein
LATGSLLVALWLVALAAGAAVFNPFDVGFARRA